MKIALDASNLRGGGGVSHLIQILAAADPVRDGFDHITVYGGSATLAQIRQDADWLTLVAHPWLDKSVFHRTAWRQMIFPNALKSGHDLLFAPGGIAASTALPRVTMCRNMLPFDHVEMARYPFGKHRLRLAILRKMQMRAFQKADGVIFLTEYARASVIEQLPRSPKSLTVIPHGIADRFCAVMRPQRELKDCDEVAPFRLLYVSSVNRYKHQWHVIDTVAALRREGFPIALDLIGHGEPDAIARLKRALTTNDDGSGHITYHGKVPFEEIHSRYQDADGFIFASTCENMPNILLEAMSAGLPILCANKEPMLEVLGGAGANADPEDPLLFAEALRAFLADTHARSAWALSARERAAEFTWNRCAKSTFGYLRDIYET